MNQVKRLIDAGSPIKDAIVTALKIEGFETVAAFAERHDRNSTNMSAILNGLRAPADADIEAFIAVLGGTPDEWRELLHEAGRPAAAKAS